MGKDHEYVPPKDYLRQAEVGHQILPNQHGHDHDHEHHHSDPEYDNYHPDGRYLKPLKPEIDYSKFDEKFDNRPQKIGSEWGSLEEQRLLFIKENALKWEKPIEYPMEFASLEPMKFKKSPMTRRWYHPCSSVERNGFLNIVTSKTALKAKYWLLYPVLIFGMTNYVFEGMYFDEYDFLEDRDLKVYDKLAQRALPFARVWTRPG